MKKHDKINSKKLENIIYNINLLTGYHFYFWWNDNENQQFFSRDGLFEAANPGLKVNRGNNFSYINTGVPKSRFAETIKYVIDLCTRIEWELSPSQPFFGMSRNAPPQRNDCSHPNNIPFHCLANHSFRSIFEKFAFWDLSNQRSFFIFPSHGGKVINPQCRQRWLLKKLSFSRLPGSILRA